MKNIIHKVAIVLALSFSACQPKNDTETEVVENVNDTQQFQLNYNAIADMIIERAMLQPGERVLLVAKPEMFDSLTLLLPTKITAAKAVYLGTFSVNNETPEEWETEFSRGASGKSGSELGEYFQSADLGIMLPGADTTHAPYAAMQHVLRNGHGRTIHFHWAGAYQMNGALKPRSIEVDELYQTALLETDYKKLSQRHKMFESAARAGTISITTPGGTDIRFEIGDRPVTKQDGDASNARSNSARNFIDREIELPAGAVRVAPIEESVEGKIVFPDMVWRGEIVKGLTMEFREGKIIKLDATVGLAAVQSELKKAGPSASSFRELAIGFNPWLAIPDVGPQWIPYYGYGSGVIRLSLGDNTELGGNVGGKYVRWNFFTDATVKIGDEVWIKDGDVVKAMPN
jgi:hypothetical protein